VACTSGTVTSARRPGLLSAKTYDLEVWLPGPERLREISSCRHFGDFRPGGLDPLSQEGSVSEFVHTSTLGLAEGRTWSPTW
jgi:seryl-tRNA synthetase